MAGEPMTTNEHRLLEVLAGSANGSTLLIDFAVDMMGGLMRRGFVTAAARAHVRRQPESK
jgi:hypothetical protein